MVKYVAALGAVVLQGAAAVNTRKVPDLQYPAPDACHPRGIITYDTTYPPCLSQGEVEGLCRPTSDDAAGWTFQRDCMCEGSFFEDAIGCGACKQCNALQGYDETAHWNRVFKNIQANFCQKATPTRAFGGYWASALSALASPTPTPDDKRDYCAGIDNTIVEKYHKASKPQGPGRARPTVTATSVAKGLTTDVATAGSFKLHAEATIRYTPAAATGTPIPLSGPKYAINSTGSASVHVDISVPVSHKLETVVTYGLAAVPCQAKFVDGFVMPICGAVELIPESEVLVTEAAKAGAVDFSACTCAVDFLAPKKLQPVSPAAPNLPSTVVPVTVFKPEECVGRCDEPAPAVRKPNCTTGNVGKPAAATGVSVPIANGVGTKADGAASAVAADASIAAADGAAPASADFGIPVAADGAALASADSGIPVAADGAAPATQGAAPIGTGIPPAPHAGTDNTPIMSGAGSTGVSAAVMAVAFAVYAL